MADDNFEKRLLMLLHKADKPVLYKSLFELLGEVDCIKVFKMIEHDLIVNANSRGGAELSLTKKGRKEIEKILANNVKNESME